MGQSKNLLEKNNSANFRPFYAPAKNLNLGFGKKQSYIVRNIAETTFETGASRGRFFRQ